MFQRARLQLTVWYACVFAAILAVVGSLAYLTIRRDLDNEIDASLESAMHGLELGIVQLDPQSGLFPFFQGRPDDDHDDDDDHKRDPKLEATLSSDLFYVATMGGDVVANPRRVDLEGVDLEALEESASDGAELTDVAGDHQRFRILSQPGPEGSYIHVGRSLDARDRQLRTLAIVLGAGGLTGLTLSTAGGFWLAGRTLSPIRRSLEMQRRFVSDASHELRTPIATVKANNELLLRHHDQTVEANLDQVEAIATETDHMARLVSDLLTLARADEGRLEIVKERVDLAGVVSELVRDVQPLAEARGVALVDDTSAAQLEGDRARMRQLAMILVDNAVKYTPSGGQVTVRTRKAGRKVELVVSDTGPGIAAEHHARIFDRFYRVDTARARRDGGTGLGLPIARWIAEVHGGQIHVDSGPGLGATFTVRLPAAS